MLITALGITPPALAGDTSMVGAWTGTTLLDDKREGIVTLSKTGALGMLDLRLATGTCRYVFRSDGTDREDDLQRIDLQPRATTALDPHCEKKPMLAVDPDGQAINLELGDQQVDLDMHQRFQPPADVVTGTPFVFDILDLSPGLNAIAARARLEAADFERKGSRVLTGPGWREEHVTYTRVPGNGQLDRLQIVYSPIIEGDERGQRIVYIQRLWILAGHYTITDIQRSVRDKYGLSLVRVGSDYAQDHHTTRDREDVDLADWKAGCSHTALQRIPFIKAFSSPPETEFMSTRCGKALTVSARPLSAGSEQISSFFIALLDVHEIWRAAWDKWLITTRLDIEAALEEIARDGDPLKL